MNARMSDEEETYDLAQFSLSDLSRCSARLRRLGAGAASMEEVAEKIVQHLHERLSAGRGAGGACALVRFYKTHPYGQLDERRRRFVDRMVGAGVASPGTPCLTLLATAGDEIAWRSVAASAGHQAIPLLSAELVARLPMVAQLFDQFGVDAGALLRPDPAESALATQSTSSVFLVPEARGSPHVPAQVGFVDRYGIRSVLGFGGALPGGEIFAILLFSKVPIAPAVAEMFRSLGRSANVAVLPFCDRVFSEGAGEREAGPPPDPRLDAMEALLSEYERITFAQAQQMERLITQQKWQLQATFNAIVDGLLIVDPKGNVAHMNESAWRILGTLDPRTVTEWPAGFGFFESDGVTPIPITRLPIVEALRGRPADRELILRRPVFASDAHLFVSARPIQDLDGASLGAVSVFRDITERVRFQKALIESKEAAEAGSRSKSEFLASMSHEIRTPMNGVLGMTGLLLGTPLSAEQRELVETIRASGDALLVIINDILDFSKIESLSFELERQPFELRACVEDALELVAHSAMAKRIEIAAIVDPALPRVIHGDVTRLRQILVNLLSNAVKFTDRGEVVVLVSPEAPGDTAAAGETLGLHVAVRDTGIGIPEEKQGRLFRSFSQVDASISRRYGGTGLGLAIVKRLVERMDGRVWVESKVGEGSTFHFTLRVEAALDPMLSAPPSSRPLTGRRALVVEPHATSRRALQLATAAWGMAPTLVASVEEAREALRAGPPFSVAIVAVGAPGTGTGELAAAMTADPPSMSPPLIVLASTIDPAIKREASALGAVACLYKPVKQAHLHDAVLSAITRRGSRARPQVAAPLDASLAKRMPLRILIAEDNTVNQKVVSLLLARLGYRADAVANGLEVLVAVQAREYDVILMDMQMPEMDGVEATSRLRAMESSAGAGRRRTCIIAVTANVLPAEREACLAAGMDDFLTKPIRQDELVAALSRAAATLSSGGAPSSRRAAISTR